jgi:hypothetical protein
MPHAAPYPPDGTGHAPGVPHAPHTHLYTVYSTEWPPLVTRSHLAIPPPSNATPAKPRNDEHATHFLRVPGSAALTTSAPIILTYSLLYYFFFLCEEGKKVYRDKLMYWGHRMIRVIRSPYESVVSSPSDLEPHLGVDLHYTLGSLQP